MRCFEEERDDFLDLIVREDEIWAHHCTPETKLQSKQWRHPTSIKSKKFKQTLSASKVIAAVFLDPIGVLLADLMPWGITINAEKYCQTLQKFRRAIKNKCSGMLTKGVSFHYHNARPHTTNQTQYLIAKFRWEVIRRLPYNSDVASSDFQMFPSLKKHLGEMTFATNDEVQEEVNAYLRNANGSWYDNCFQ